MNKLSCIVMLLFFSISMAAQTPNIIGKWKVVAANNGVYYNYKTDSSYATKSFLDSLKGKEDSAETVSMFTSFVSMYNNYHFSFDKNNTYQEIRNGEPRVWGTYTINASGQTIYVLYGNGGRKNLLILNTSLLKAIYCST